MQRISILFSLLWLTSIAIAQGPPVDKETTTPLPTIAEFTAEMAEYPGYFSFYWDAKKGKIWLEIDKWNQEFLYVNSLPAGIGSNDIGLDRGQLGENRVVRFYRSGSKVLLLESNYKFRAESENAAERKAVEEAFAQSVQGGFTVAAEQGEMVLVDITDFLLRDAHNVAGRLKQTKQGTYKADPNRSAIYMEGTKNFPQNSEFEAIVTFLGDPEGDFIKSVAPSPDAVTVRMHHSFIQLPDDNYQPRAFDPRSGFFEIQYLDYAQPIDQPVVQRYIVRHRLEKKDPGAKVSDPVEPIVYYVDPGAPEPIKSALIEGASWWNQAFEAAGYRNAFQVKELPEGADPMDVRYNFIQWVHRSTRGWSYGATVIDPRTGEIIKGHVSLGSLRVRQDFLIAQGLIPGYEKGETPDPQLEAMALARLRQLSAHEVGHTIGLAHNFAASYNGRASVMDYPHPYITLDKKEKMDFSSAYDNKIGEWDKRTVRYGYQDFPEGTDEAAALAGVIKENIGKGFLFLSDQDARPEGSAHPYAHLWDNGKSAPQELDRLLEVRRKALADFGENNIPPGTPYAELERVLVPLYFGHRYQTEATAKVIGGVNYSYAMRGDGQVIAEPIAPEAQEAAMKALLNTLKTEELTISPRILQLIPPEPLGYNRDRELFSGNTSPIFDPLAAVEASASQTIRLLLNPQRMARVLQQHSMNGSYFSPTFVFESLFTRAFFNNRNNPYEVEVAHVIEKVTVDHMLRLAGDRKGSRQVAALALMAVQDLEDQFRIELASADTNARKAHCMYLLEEIKRFRAHPEAYQWPEVVEMPPGQPIGSCEW
ncbi:MAG: zinc-dependent metalloprotease [Saprospirales bacterium]|nr:zinc-dependent metalloprotease [Saprospirales bacterium]